MKYPVNIAASLLLVLLPAAAAAMEWLSSDDLEQSCDSFLAESGSDAGALCLAYMQGFIAGSGTIEARAVGGRDAAPGDESFTERAIRTRLGTLRLQQIRNIGDSGHCLGDDVAAVTVVEKIADYFNKHPQTLKLTNAEAVREALVYHYPCPK